MAYTYSYSSLSLSLSLSLSVGVTEQESLQNFKEWIDLFVLMFCRSVCLVKDLDGNRIYGLLHNMEKGGHDDFKFHLSNFRVWGAECEHANLSGRKYFSVSPSGRCETQLTHIRLVHFSDF